MRKTDPFLAVYGKPAWLVKRGHGSFITLNFGEPALVIREPKQAADDVSEAVRKLLSRRKIDVVGKWSILIQMSDWKIFENDQKLADNTSTNFEVDKACEFIDGQYLVDLKIDESKTEFKFDLGGVILTSSKYKDDDVQWGLYKDGAIAATFYNNGLLQIE